MEVSSDAGVHRKSLIANRTQEIDWDAYASQYDLLAKHNPSYRENIELLRSFLGSFGLPEHPSVCDIGAGTGNFICALANDLPEARFVHLDSDPNMNSVAEQKYAAAGIESVDIHSVSALSAEFEPNTFDLIICINALYAIRPPMKVLQQVRSWLKPGGVFFVIDFGRRSNVWDWSSYILGSVFREYGFLACIRLLTNGIETYKQNRRGSKGQAAGVYWLHSTDEFKDALQRAGFSVEHIQTCYRDYCDLAVCRSPSD